MISPRPHEGAALLMIPSPRFTFYLRFATEVFPVWVLWSQIQERNARKKLFTTLIEVTNELNGHLLPSSSANISVFPDNPLFEEELNKIEGLLQTKGGEVFTNSDSPTGNVAKAEKTIRALSLTNCWVDAEKGWQCGFLVQKLVDDGDEKLFGIGPG